MQVLVRWELVETIRRELRPSGYEADLEQESVDVEETSNGKYRIKLETK